jgi:drug/metabolite transporter (DMT)-like permease
MPEDTSKAGFAEMAVFCAALVAGTACSLTSKVMLSLKSVGITGEVEDFSFPLFQTFGMSLGMTAGLVMHLAVGHWRIPFPGYVHPNETGQYQAIDEKGKYQPIEKPAAIEKWMYFLLIIPALLDIIAYTLCMFGLQYVNVSIYQMLRGGAIVFVAILKHFVIGHKLPKYRWIGVMWNVVAIILVGYAALLTMGDSSIAKNNDVKYIDTIFGVMLILSGALVQSLQYAFEEKVLSMDVPIPPPLLIGMEGLWGTIICLFVLYPCCYCLPGTDHGSLENPFNTYTMFMNSSDVRSMFAWYIVFTFSYNLFSCLIVKMLSAIWATILDNFRPISVWVTDLFIFYFITTSFGESWNIYSYIQLLGLLVLLYGTAIYNAPNALSVKLTGRPIDFFLDFSEEYREAEEANEDMRLNGQDNAHDAPFLATISPFMTPRQNSSRVSLSARTSSHQNDV